jgi:transcriptional regulator with XRE-family HTH domain
MMQIRDGHALRRLRKEARLTQGQLADEAGMSREWIGQIERGQSEISLQVSCALLWVVSQFVDYGHIQGILGERAKAA